jgi:hypothetical protein
MNITQEAHLLPRLLPQVRRRQMRREPRVKQAAAPAPADGRCAWLGGG